VNLLLTSAGLAGSAVHELLSAADRLGTQVLPRAPLRGEDLVAAASWREHSSCLGWLLSQDRLEDPTYQAEALARLAGHSGQLLGVEMTRPPAAQLPRAIAFVACGEHLLRDLDDLTLPKLLLVPPGRGGAAAEGPAFLGRVEG
jgi:hypothetical protein